MKTKNLLGGIALLVSSTTTFASLINVGGVIWDPDAVTGGTVLSDFIMNGGIFELPILTGIPGEQGGGFGKVERINSAVANGPDFCPGCELTFDFTTTLRSLTPHVGDPTTADFEFENLIINFYVDHTPDYLLDNQNPHNHPTRRDTATDGTLWLSLVLAPGEFLTGTGTNLTSGTSDAGTGTAVLDAVGGLAVMNFDTNSQVGGADAVLSSSFQLDTNAIDDHTFTGTFDITANTIPVPSSLALFGLALFGFAGTRRKIKK